MNQMASKKRKASGPNDQHPRDIQTRVSQKFTDLTTDYADARYYVGFIADDRGRKIGKHGFTLARNWPTGRQRQINGGIRRWRPHEDGNWHFYPKFVVSLKLHEARALEDVIRQECRIQGIRRYNHGADFYDSYDCLAKLAKDVCKFLGLSMSRFE
jgi:hypothetical protein